MDGKGRAIDNIFIEQLWRTVQYENVYLQEYLDGGSLYKGLENYFKFYNNDCSHESLDYNTPKLNVLQKRSGMKIRTLFSLL